MIAGPPKYKTAVQLLPPGVPPTAQVLALSTPALKRLALEKYWVVRGIGRRGILLSRCVVRRWDGGSPAQNERSMDCPECLSGSGNRLLDSRPVNPQRLHGNSTINSSVELVEPLYRERYAE